MSKTISGSQTGSESRMQVISRADFQPGLRMLHFVVRIDMVTLEKLQCAACGAWPNSGCCVFCEASSNRERRISLHRCGQCKSRVHPRSLPALCAVLG